MNRLLFLGLLPLALAGCASGPATPLHIDVPDIARSNAVTVRDARPPLEAKREIMSLLVTSDAYGITRAGDLRTDPSVMRLIQHRVYERADAGTHVTVNHLVTYLNMQPQLKAGALGALLGPIGAAIAASHYNGQVASSTTQVDRAQFDAMTGDAEWKRALFTQSENPKKVPVVVTYLDLEVDGKRAFVRVVSSLQLDAGQNAILLATQATIQEAVKQLSDSTPSAVVAATAGTPAALAAVTQPVVASTSSVATDRADPVGPTTLAAVISAAQASSQADLLRHVDAQTIEGREFVFPSWNTQTYRDVHLVFKRGRVEASNQRDHTSGTYTVAGDKVCLDLVSRAWGKTCYVVIEASTGENAHGLQIMAVPGGDRLPLTIR